MKEVRTPKLHIVWFYLYDIAEIAKYRRGMRGWLQRNQAHREIFRVLELLDTEVVNMWLFFEKLPEMYIKERELYWMKNKRKNIKCDVWASEDLMQIIQN